MSRNKGIGVARGRFITFCDTDDYINKNIYSKIIHFMLETSINTFIFGYTSDAKYLDSFDDDISMINPNNALRGTVWRNIYDRHLLIENNIRLHIISYSEDLPFNYDYLKLANCKIGWINRKYYFYRRHSNQTMQKTWLPNLNKYQGYYNSLKYAVTIVKDNLLLTATDKQLNSYAFSLLMNA